MFDYLGNSQDELLEGLQSHIFFVEFNYMA